MIVRLAVSCARGIPGNRQARFGQPKPRGYQLVCFSLQYGPVTTGSRSLERTLILPAQNCSGQHAILAIYVDYSVIWQPNGYDGSNIDSGSSVGGLGLSAGASMDMQMGGFICAVMESLC